MLFFQSLTLIRITQPRAAVRQLSKHSRKHRVNEMSSTRAILSAESSTVIFETELKSLDRKEKERLLKSAGITKGMTPEQGLALKADLGLPWNRLRMLRRYSLEQYICNNIWQLTLTNYIMLLLTPPTSLCDAIGAPLCIYIWMDLDFTGHLLFQVVESGRS